MKTITYVYLIRFMLVVTKHQLQHVIEMSSTVINDSIRCCNYSQLSPVA